MRIVFTKSKKKFAIGSVAIRLYQQTEYSHVALEFKESGEIYYYQANEGKVNIEHKSHFDREHEIVEAFKVSVNKAALKELKKTLGQNYGTAQNAGVLIVDILKNLGRLIKNPFGSGVNCSELIFVNVLAPKYNLTHRDPNSIKPKHIYDMLKNVGAKRG